MLRAGGGGIVKSPVTGYTRSGVGLNEFYADGIKTVIGAVNTADGVISNISTNGVLPAGEAPPGNVGTMIHIHVLFSLYAIGVAGNLQMFEYNAYDGTPASPGNEIDFFQTQVIEPAGLVATTWYYQGNFDMWIPITQTNKITVRKLTSGGAGDATIDAVRILGYKPIR